MEKFEKDLASWKTQHDQLTRSRANLQVIESTAAGAAEAALLRREVDDLTVKSKARLEELERRIAELSSSGPSSRSGETSSKPKA